MAESNNLVASPDPLAERAANRRAFFTAALGAAVVGAGAFAFSDPAAAQSVTDNDLLNFALNIEYLQANYYNFAVSGAAIGASLTSGAVGVLGTATGGRTVTFADAIVGQYAREIVGDKLAHVSALRSSLGSAAAAQPAIDVGTGASGAFSRIAQQAGITSAGASFDPYANDEAFLLGAFILSDIGVAAYRGLIGGFGNILIAQAAAGLLATEAYHGAMIRNLLYRKGQATPALIDRSEALSGARDVLDGGGESDQGLRAIIRPGGTESNIAPTDADGIVLGRDTGRTLNILYVNGAAVTSGGFFPAGMNGNIKTSAAN